MPYYRGDGGNYYRGDPFLGALVGGIVGGAAKRAAKWVAKKVTGSAGRVAGTILREAAPSTVAGAIGYAAGRGMMPTLSPIPQLGPESTSMGVVPMYPKRRRMNPLNPKALRRALRRAEGFEKFAQRTVNSLYRVIDGRKVRTYKKRKAS